MTRGNYPSAEDKECGSGKESIKYYYKRKKRVYDFFLGNVKLKTLNSLSFVNSLKPLTPLTP